MESLCQEISESVESKRRTIYAGLSKLDSSLIRLDGSERDAIRCFVNYMNVYYSQGILVMVKEIQQIRILKNKIIIIKVR